MSDHAAVKALLEAAPDSLEELFNRDPMGYTKQDLTVIVAKLREQRAAWLKAEAAGKKSLPKAPKAKIEPSLEDLGL